MRYRLTIQFAKNNEPEVSSMLSVMDELDLEETGITAIASHAIEWIIVGPLTELIDFAHGVGLNGVEIIEFIDCSMCV